MELFMKTMRYAVSAAVLAGAVLALSPANASAQDAYIILQPADMFAEGIAGAPDGDLFVGSLARGEIWRLGRNTHTHHVFASPESGLMSVIGVHVSRDGERVYACSSDPAGLHPGRNTELFVFDRASGAVLGRYEFPGGGLCNDIAERADGTVLATDSFQPRILALTPDGAFTEWLRDEAFAGEGFSLNGIAEIGEAVYTVKYNSGQLFRIDEDAQGRHIREVELDRPLAGPDGLELLDDGSLLVVEGHAGALSRIRFSEDGMSGNVESVADGYDVPTTVAAWGGAAYVVEGQLDHFFGMDPSAPGPFRVRRTPLE